MTSLLVRHPSPHPVESPWGYSLRLSESNGYATPWSLFKLAGLRQNEVRTTGMKIAKLAAITGLPQATLARMSFAPHRDRPRWCRILGHDILPTDIDLMNPCICPFCVQELGYVEALWHLRFMVGCPVHHLEGIKQCAACLRPIRWYRPGLTECTCGADLASFCAAPLSEAEACLLSILRRKTLSDGRSENNPAKFPQAELLASDLRTILVVVRTLGRFAHSANGYAGCPSDRQIVSAASSVLANWPENFFALLQALGSRFNRPNALSVRNQFDGIINALFKNKSIKKAAKTDFLKLAFATFATERWGKGVADPRLFKKQRNLASERFLTKAQFANKLGLQPRTLTRFLKQRDVPLVTLQSGGESRVIVDTQGLDDAGTLPGTILRARDAARSLGISVSLLRLLRQTEIFKVTRLSSVRQGFHSLDIEVFRMSLLSRSRSEGEQPNYQRPDFVQLKHIARSRRDTSAVQSQLIVAILADQISAFSSPEKTIGSLLLDRATCDRFTSLKRSKETGNTIGIGQAARLLRCDQAAIGGLVTLGVLNRITTPIGARISVESIDAFNTAYVALSRLARSERTSSRSLMKRCTQLGIQPLLAATGTVRGPQPFLCRTELAKLKLHPCG